MASRSSEQKRLGFLKLNNNESLTERDGCGGESVGKVAIEPEEEFLPHLPFGLHLLGSLETVEDLRAVSEAISNRN